MPDGNLPALSGPMKPTSSGEVSRRFRKAAAALFSRSEVAAREIRATDATGYGDGLISAAYTLLGNTRRQARTRAEIYEKWGYMMGDPIVSTALSLLVTAALGGDGTSGEMVFLEDNPNVKAGGAKKMVEEIKRDLSPILNRVAFQLAYNAAGFGDSYGRVYCGDEGVVDVYVDELVSPATVLPFEQGNQTIAFASSVGEKQLARLTLMQMARCKMPRKVFVPQVSVTEKVWRATLEADRIEDLPVLPSAAGGSFLYEAEPAYDNMNAALLGLVGQRILDSVDESVLGVNMAGATADQQKSIAKSVERMLTTSKERAARAVKENRPILERIRHVLPFWNDKQIVNFDMGSAGQSKRSGNITIEDVMVHARMLAGSLGPDLGLIGFADQMPASLGEGGSFRSSATVAERARVIRGALSECFNHIINIHTHSKYGVVFEAADRPWQINYYGSISALEAEQAATRERSMNSSLVLVQAMEGAKALGMKPLQFKNFLSKQCRLDEEDAKLYQDIVTAPPGPGAAGDPFGDPLPGGEGGFDPGGGSDDDGGGPPPALRKKRSPTGAEE